MTEDRFERALERVLVHEGGFVDHPRDPGGATNRGVTQATYDNWRRRHGLPTRSVRQLAESELRAIYREGYWDAIRADELPPGVAYAVFDAAVNSGPARAARWLQAQIGARVDGVVGPETIGRTQAVAAVPLILRYSDARLAFMRRLPHWDAFGRGWARRVEEVRVQAVQWAQGFTPSPSEAEAPGKADRGPRRAAESRTVRGGAAAAAGGLGAALSDVAETLEPLAPISETLRWVFLAVVVAGAAYAIWARLDDMRTGER